MEAAEHTAPAGSTEADVLAAYEAGLSSRACAAKFGPGLTPGRVIAIVRSNGGRVRPRGRRLKNPAGIPDLPAALRTRPLTDRQAASEFGVSKDTASRVRARVAADYIRPAETARMLGLSMSALTSRLRRGTLVLTAERTPGAHRRFLRSEVEAEAARKETVAGR